MPNPLYVTVLSLMIPVFVTAAVAGDTSNAAAPWQVKMKTLDGKDVDLSKYNGKVLLIVNTASRCGYTPQYKELEALHEKYSKDGLAVLGFPCNQFGRQEPGTPKQIADFCTSKFNVQFDMFEKIDVKGKKQSPVYKWLTSSDATPSDPGTVKWNFEKFLIGRDGKVIARYRSNVEPSSTEVVSAIETALKK
jgi:glutathione peroxidase